MQNTVNLSKDENISVEKVEGNYVITLPNSYDVYWEFTQKTSNFGTFTKEKSTDKKQIIFTVPVEAVNTDKAVAEFNSKVNQAKTFVNEIMKEKDDFNYIINFDKQQPGKTVTFLYSNPTNGYMIGEVIRAGKYFVAFDSGMKDKTIFVRMVYTNRLLNGKEDFINREQTIAEMFPVGSVKYLSYIKKDDKVKIIAKDYDKNAKKKTTKIKQ